jgi:hypothetical protein
MNRSAFFSFTLLLLMALALSSCTRTAPEPTEVAQEADPMTPSGTTPAEPLDVQASPSECLQGIWIMEEDSFNALINTLLPMPNFGILSGVVTLSFDQFLYIYNFDDLTIRFTANPENYIQGTGSVSSSGSFSVAGNNITFNNTSTSSAITDWEALVDGELSTYPGDPPTLFFTLPGSGAFDCSGNSLSIDTSGTTDTPTMMNFQRIN